MKSFVFCLLVVQEDGNESWQYEEITLKYEEPGWGFGIAEDLNNPHNRDTDVYVRILIPGGDASKDDRLNKYDSIVSVCNLLPTNVAKN